MEQGVLRQKVAQDRSHKRLTGETVWKNAEKKKAIIAVVIVIALAAAALAFMQHRSARPTLDDFEGTFLMSDGRCIKMKADPTDEYDMTGRIYKEGDEEATIDVVGVYTPAGSISVEEPGDDGMMIGIMSVKSFGRLEYADMDTMETFTLEKMNIDCHYKVKKQGAERYKLNY